MRFLRALRQCGGQKDGADANNLNDKELLLSSGYIYRITQDLLQRFHIHWEDGTE